MNYVLLDLLTRRTRTDMWQKNMGSQSYNVPLQDATSLSLVDSMPSKGISEAEDTKPNTAIFTTEDIGDKRSPYHVTKGYLFLWIPSNLALGCYGDALAVSTPKGSKSWRGHTLMN